MDERDDEFPPAYWVYGVPCGSYEDACLVAGADTPASLAAEAAEMAAEDAIRGLREPPYLGGSACPPGPDTTPAPWGDLPF